MSWASKSSLTATWTTGPSKLKFQQEIRSYVKAKHKHLLHDASFLMMTFPLKMSLQGLKDEMNHFYCCVCQGKHSQAKTLKTTSLGNIEKAGMVRKINIKLWTSKSIYILYIYFIYLYIYIYFITYTFCDRCPSSLRNIRRAWRISWPAKFLEENQVNNLR